MRDTGSYGFLLPESQILPTCLENIEGVRAVYEYVRPESKCGQKNCGENGNCIFDSDVNVSNCVCNDGYILSSDTVTCDPTIGKPPTENVTCNVCNYAKYYSISNYIYFIYLFNLASFI